MLTDEEEGPLQYEVYKSSSSDTQPLKSYVIGCNSNHNNFKPVNDLSLHDLPEDIKCIELLNLIDLNINLTVMIHVENPNATIDEEMNTFGSGSICYFSDTHDLYTCNHVNSDKCKKCHIPNCPYLESFGEGHFMVTNYESHLPESELERAHLAFRVSTNQHVVRDAEKAKNATVQLFYHNEERTDTLTAKVAGLCESWEEQDKVHLVCVMDMNVQVKTLLQSMRCNFCQLFQSIPQNIIDTFINNYVVVVCHPHGTPKVISIGKTIKCTHKQSSNGQWYVETRYQVETCLGCSGAPVIGPGWRDGAPVYRVHCGYVILSKSNTKLCISKSHWFVNSDARGGTFQGPS